MLNAIFGGSASSAPPVTITATNEPFGTGNGSATQFQLSYQGTALFTFTDATIYRNDWQGNQKLVTTPRTNNSASINNFSAYLGTTITPNAGTAPDGSNTAALISYQSGAGGNLYQLLNNAVGLQTYSIYAKAGTVGAQFTVGNDKFATPALVTFNLFTGVVVSSSGGATGSILPMGNGWYRCSVTFTEPSGMASDSFVTLPQDRPGTIYQWGAQAEVGSVATPYITTTSAPVTITDYSISSAALVTLAVAPVAGAVMNWTGHSTAYPTGTYVFIVDNGDMTIDYGIAGTLPSAVFLALLRGGYIPLKPEAVHINGYYTPSVTNTPLFGFDTENFYISGFDVGSWAVSA
ncbi:phage head spike fiber domain-containing protein [Burkholderia sp. PAMC 28687]|uniref:phage head spike fiber domain-containing protein n=1 Tax=Burkholderia sp. PAMC 28687 TaxID=1795874 RepID=UPI003FA426DA